MARALLLSAAVLGLAACAPAAPVRPSIETDRAAIDAVRRQFIETYVAGDAARAAELYEDGAVIMPSGRPNVKGRTAILEFEKQTFAQIAVSNLEFTSDHTEIMAAWAVDRGTFKATAAPRTGGPPATDTGRYLIVLHRQTDGSWKVSADIDNK